MEIKPATPLAQKKTPRTSADTIFITVGLLCVVGVVQIWIVSAGGISWPEYTNKYMRLARAFLHGQVSLLDKPSPQLLAVKDPYDPRQSYQYRDPQLHDVALFEGKYYLYWGPVPAAIVAAGSWIIRDPMPDMGDQYLVLAFMFGTSILAAVLMLQIKSVFFPELARWAIVPPVLSLGLGTPMLFTLARPAVYEAAIGGGQFFLIAGLCTAFAGLQKLRPRLLLVTGILWVLAIGCRISLLPAVAVMVLITFWRIWHIATSQNAIRPAWKAAMGLCLPLFIGGVLNAWYNFARFRSIFEFGTSYVLAGAEAHRLGTPEFMTFGHLIPNLYRYLIEGPHWEATFPYVEPVQYQLWFYNRFNLSDSYDMEKLTGLAWTQPFLIFGLFSLSWIFGKSPAAPSAVSPLAASPDRSLRGWLITSLISAAVLGIAAPLTLVLSTMRYLMDCTPALSVLACIGFWKTLQVLRNRSRVKTIVCSAVVLIVVAQSILGLLMGVTGYYEHFRLHNSVLYSEMAQWFSF
jgi:hypothetical protein